MAAKAPPAPTLEDSLAAVEAMQKSDQAAFEAMAREAANGNAPDPAELSRLLLSTGKDIAAFRQLVQVFNRRNEWRENIKLVAEAHQKRAELKSEIERHNEELEKHVAAHQAACQPIQFELQKLMETITTKDGGERELLQSCPSSELWQKHNELTRRMDNLSKAIRNENDELERVQADVPHRTPGAYDHRLNAIRERITNLQEQFSQAQAESVACADAMRNY